MNTKVTTEKGATSICSTIFAEDVQRIVDINGFDLDIEPKGNLIIFKNTDIPGVIGHVGTTLAKNNVNIADFRLGRNAEQALAVIITDSTVNKTTLKELSELEACISVDYAQI